MKILVTGANGYLGQGIVTCLINMGHQVVATDFCIDNVDKRAYGLECDLFSVKDPYDYFREPEVVLHLAWRDGFVHYSDAHVTDLPKHYEFIKKLSTSCVDRIAVMGSMHEVGFYEGCIRSDTPCNPSTPYGICKNALRELLECLVKQNNKMYQWLRGYYIVGNSEFGSSIFSKITAAEKKGEEYFPFTMGKNQFDFIDYSDFCKSVARVVCQNEVLGIINICSGYPEKLSDRVERFIRDNEYSIKLRYGAFPDRPYDSKALWGDGSLLEKVNSMY